MYRTFFGLLLINCNPDFSSQLKFKSFALSENSPQKVTKKGFCIFSNEIYFVEK